MRIVLISIMLIFLSFGCDFGYKKKDQIDSTICLEILSKEYVPSTIDLNKSINDSLKSCILNLTNLNDSSITKCIYMILLKQCLYQLKTTNRTFDLIEFRNTPAKKILDIYIKVNKLDSVKLYNGSKGGQGLFSHQIYYNVLNTRNYLLKYKEIEKVIIEIKIELFRIDNFIQNLNSK